MIINIICIGIALFCIGFALHTWNKRKQNDTQIEEKENELKNLENVKNQVLSNIKILQEQVNDLNSKNITITLAKNNEEQQLELLKKQEKETRERITELSKGAETAYDTQKELAGRAFENYCDILSKNYEEKAEEYELLCSTLEKSYASKQEKLIENSDQIQKEIDYYREELDKIKQNRAAAMEAMVREQSVKDNLSAYCIQIADVDKADIQRLENVKLTLSKPRVLSMLIWQTWFQKPLKTLTANILGTNTVIGIYKITNIQTGQCYIGQAVNVATRWTEHCKCGLGIDTPAQNKLYQAMKEYNIWNFSWELLEECDVCSLNEREKYYIEMYNSYEFGYNSNRGVSK